jgi:sortase A
VIRRAIRDFSSVLILTGVLLLVDAGVTLIWQEPVTAAIALVKRSDVSHQYLSYRTAPLTHTQAKAVKQIHTSKQRISYLARTNLARIKTGDAIGQIEIPKIGHTYNIVQGDQASQLEDGPGHYPSTALPGMGQTVGVAGHRTTYLAPFRFINELHRGNRIYVTMPYGKFTYVVQKQQIVQPTAVWVVNNVGYDRLVLSACNPIYSASQRIIVFAKLHSVTPLGPARVAG